MRSVNIGALTPAKIAMVGGAVVALAAVVFVAARRAQGDKRSASEMLGAALGSAAAGAAVGTAVGAVKGVGAAVGIPDTNTDRCAAAKAAGSTWDASLYCAAGDFLAWTKARIFGASDPVTLPTGAPVAGASTVDAIRPTLSQGASGNAVRELQGKLGITVDGYFGPVTAQAVRDFQASKLLIVDGIVGPATWAALDTGIAVIDQNGVLTDSQYRDMVR